MVLAIALSVDGLRHGSAAKSGLGVLLLGAGAVYLVRAVRLRLLLVQDRVVVRNLFRTYRFSRASITAVSADGNATVIFSRLYYPQLDAICLRVSLDNRVVPIDVTATALMKANERVAIERRLDRSAKQNRARTRHD